MDKKKIIVNVFSNWTNFIAAIVIAFFVSPIIVHNLGNENYGIWTLIVSVTGFFTVLDFGVNTAIVRFISMYKAKADYRSANEIYSTSFILFIIIGLGIFLVTTVFAYFFKDFFNIEGLGRTYLFFVFFVVGTDLAFGFVFSVYQATLSGLQEFLKINIISVSTLVVKNILIVFLLTSGFSLMSMAFVQVIANLLRAACQCWIIRKNFGFLSFSREHYNKSVLKQVFNYSIYSFIISIALKVLFFTDSVVIGRLLKVSEVTFYAIPAMIMQYSEKIIWAVSAVLIPVISSYNAIGEEQKNKNIYVLGSKYSLMLSVPIIFVLYTNGSNFISIWMGEEYGMRAEWVMKILVVGYAFYLPQMISHGILKGISKHKVFAYVLIGEAVVNLIMSVVLVKYYGIEGVALGTAVPLIVVNVMIVPAYTCYVLKMNIVKYLRESYLKPLLGLILLFVVHYFIRINVQSYYEFALFGMSVLLFMTVYSVFFIIEKSHLDWAVSGIRNKLHI